MPGPVEKQQEFRDSDTSENPIPKKTKQTDLADPKLCLVHDQARFTQPFSKPPRADPCPPSSGLSPKSEHTDSRIADPRRSPTGLFSPPLPLPATCEHWGELFTLCCLFPYFFHHFQPCWSCSVLLLMAFLFPLPPFASKPCFLWVCLMEPVPMGGQE